MFVLRRYLFFLSEAKRTKNVLLLMVLFSWINEKSSPAAKSIICEFSMFCILFMHIGMSSILRLNGISVGKPN